MPLLAIRNVHLNLKIKPLQAPGCILLGIRPLYGSRSSLVVSLSFATAVQGVMTYCLKVPPLYLMLVRDIYLQLVGLSLTDSLPTHGYKIMPQQYAYQVVMGLCFGLGVSTVLTLALLVVIDAELHKCTS